MALAPKVFSSTAINLISEFFNFANPPKNIAKNENSKHHQT